MGELQLQQWQQRPYGRRANGVIEADHGTIDVTVREPIEWDPETGLTYVLANGWTAGKNSMRLPAITATGFGHRAITFNYSNTGSSEALKRNVEDVIEIVDAAQQARVAAIGLSMGGAVLTKALRELGPQLESATLVAPGMYVRSDLITEYEVARRFLSESLEVTEISKGLRNALFLGITSVSNCLKRPTAVRAEIRELLSGTVHEDLRYAKAQPDAPFVRFMYGLNDRLIPAYGQELSIQGLPLDQIIPYEGGHAKLAYHQSLSIQIFEEDAKILASNNPAVPLAA